MIKKNNIHLKVKQYLKNTVELRKELRKAFPKDSKVLIKHPTYFGEATVMFVDPIVPTRLRVMLPDKAFYTFPVECIELL